MKFFQFFREQNVNPPKGERVKLVSVHIPKTAGTSFRKTLKVNYGEKAVIRLDITLNHQKLRIDQELFEASSLPIGTEVVHGHFRPRDLVQRFPETKALPFITWLRDPVERVISNYFYLEKRLKEELDEEGKNLNILSKMQRSLLEYARGEINRNRHVKFLEGMPLEDFAFVGILEHYAEDLAELGQRMGWSSVEEITVNVTAKAKPVVSDEIRAEIAQLNADDMALYERALHLRARRKATPEIELISIHVPKTAGTSFYHALRQVYGGDLSISYRRKDLQLVLERYGSFSESLTGEVKVIHGHLRYAEVEELRKIHAAKLICWLRDPVDRVVSNYRHFKARLTNSELNPEVYLLNKHRKNESLETYASLEENRNVMTKFLSGIDVDDLYFVGIQEHYGEDLDRLGKRLEWPAVEAIHLNEYKPKEPEESYDDPEIRNMIAELNQDDIALYDKALQRRKLELDGGV